MATTYTGSVDLISGIRPKNGGSFPLVEASDVLYASGGVRLNTLLNGFTSETGSIKTYVDNAISTETSARTSADTALSSRVSTLESAVGSGGSVATQISTAVNTEKTRAQGVESGLDGRVSDLETAVGTGGTVDSKISSAVSTEQTRATTAESALNSRVTAVETAANTTLPNLISQTNSALTTESTTRAEADEDLDERVSALESQVDDLEGNMLVVSSTSAMSDTTKMYINTADNCWYYYNASTSAWVNGGQAAGVSIDSLLTTQGAAADAKAVGDAISELSSDLDDISKTVKADNTYCISDGLFTKTSNAPGTDTNGITFTWDGDICTVNGTSTSYSVNLLKYYATLPETVIPGSTIYACYTTTDTNVQLRIIWRDANNNDTFAYITQNSIIRVPQNATKWSIGLYITPGKSFDHAIVSNVAILNAPPNKDIDRHFMTGKELLANGTNLNDVKNEGHYILNGDGTYTYYNSPLSAGCAGTLIVFRNSSSTITQLVISITSDAKIYIRTSLSGIFSMPWKAIGGDAGTEMHDIRIGYDGTEYESAGAAVRGQIADIYDFFITSNEISEVLTD